MAQSNRGDTVISDEEPLGLSLDPERKDLEASKPTNAKRLLFLLLCIPYKITASKFHQRDTSNIHSDRDLFQCLRSTYQGFRGRLFSLFSLKTMRRINFVQFEAYPSELVDIHKIDHLPPESKKDEYHYTPMPAELVPPIGSNALMHWYRYPQHAEDIGLVLDKIPKKMRGKLACNGSEGTKLGWGLEFVEALDWTKLWIYGFTGFLLGVGFGVAWSILKHDVQSAFGVTACMLVGLGFTTGVLQDALEPK